MIQATVLHNGFIIDEIHRTCEMRRYNELAVELTMWHDLPGHDCDEPPAQVVAMLDELKELKLGAFVRAGRRYREALDAWEQRLNFEAFRASLGFPVERDTVVDYPPDPKPPLVLDFTYPA
jgi:hypothetical protein